MASATRDPLEARLRADNPTSDGHGPGHPDYEALIARWTEAALAAAQAAPPLPAVISSLGAAFKSALPAPHHGRFGPVFAAVRVLLEAGEPALARQTILATPVPPELESVREAMAALIPDTP